MPRIRTVKPEHWNDKNLPNISLQAHLLWIGTWNFSDDKGVFEADPLLLKSQIFPRRTDIRLEDINKWLEQLVNARYVIPFQFNKEGYYISRTFNAHQRIDKPQPSKIPEDVIQKAFVECSENVPGLVALYSKGEESSVKESKAVGYAFPSDDFKNKYDEWLTYRKEKKKPLAAKSIEYQMKFLQKFDETTAIQIIETSIANGWQGLFDPKDKANGTHQQSTSGSSKGAKPGTSTAQVDGLTKLRDKFATGGKGAKDTER